MAAVVSPYSDVIPQMSRFIGRCGVLQAREIRGKWVWRFAGLREQWAGNAKSIAEALDQAAAACGMAHFEAGWREVRP